VGGVNAKLISLLSAAIRDITQRSFELRSAIAIGGGSINAAFRLEGNDGACYFLKLNEKRYHSMFAAEAAGLAAIAATNAIREKRSVMYHRVLRSFARNRARIRNGSPPIQNPVANS